MNNYKIWMYKSPDKKKLREENKSEDKEPEFLGSILIDDHGVSNNLTLIAKAMRRASGLLLTADKFIVERMK